MKKIIKKFMPDILIIVGIFVFAFGYFGECLHQERNSLHCYNYQYAIIEPIGVILFVIGIDIVIRKYILKK